MKASGLPIDRVLPALAAALETHASAVLEAPPGAGKSTVVPLALLESAWTRGKRMVMLEPRRLAARAVARRMAWSLGEPVGQTVGYRMRLDTRVSRATRIEVVTEGVLTRMLQGDPALEGVALVIFDEFHERSLSADLGLALALDARDALAPALRILVMSATLETEPVSRLLGDAAVIRAEARAFAVETHYVGGGPPLLPEGDSAARRRAGTASPEQLVARAVGRALRESEGDVLVFLPGAREIRRVRSLLEAAELDPAVRILALFGDLDAAAQEAALTPAPAGLRKVVLATNIAETSLTIDGVRVVVDSGLVRRALFDPSTGMSRLETRRVSQASADQRRGRAGRTAPGVCYRIWSAGAQASLAPVTPPEILGADLATLALELADWGAAEASAMRWLDPPPAAMLAAARDLLRRLGALDAAGRITGHGREMAALAVHPRLAHMLLEARALGADRLGARLAALLSDRDLLRGGAGAGGSAGAGAGARAHGAAAHGADVRTRLGLLAEDRTARADSSDGAGVTPGAARVARGALRRAERFARELERQLGALGGRRAGGVPSRAADVPRGPGKRRRRPRDAPRQAAGAARPRAAEDALAGVLLACAYPDRIGRRRAGPEPRYALANGRGASFPEGQTLGREPFIVAIELDDRDRDARILLAAPIAREDIEARFAADLEHADEVEWNAREEAVVARRVMRLGALVLDEKPLRPVPPEATRAAMLAGLRSLGLAALPWTDAARNLAARVELVRRLLPVETADWPAVDDGSLEASLEQWLAPWLENATRREHLARVPLLDALRALLGPERLRRLDVLAPERLEVPSGSRVRIDYRDENAPAVAVRLQEVFGLAETPRLVDGRAPVTFKLLSPAARPVQVTRDLASFWRTGYGEVRKDLRGRYPKHDWPANPLEAEAVRGVRPRARRSRS